MSYKLKPRNWYYKTLQVAKRELGLDDDEYRAVLQSNGAKIKGDKISATTMSVSQLDAALSHMKKSGFTMKQNPANFKEGMLKKCEAIWHQLHDAGVLRAPYSEAVLTKFAHRHTGANHIKWADVAGFRSTIEALKGMAKREGVKLND